MASESGIDNQLKPVVSLPTPETRELLTADQMKVFSIDLILRAEQDSEGKSIAKLGEKSTRENWGQSPDNRLRLLFYDIQIAQRKDVLEKIRGSFREKQMTPEAGARISEITKQIEELNAKRQTLNPYLDKKLQSDNILNILSEEIVDPKKPWVVEDIKDPIGTFYWVINSYDGQAKMIAWMRQHGVDGSLINFYQEKHDMRLFDHLENLEVRAIDADAWVKLESSARRLKTILQHRHDQFPLDVVRKFEHLIANPSSAEKLSAVLQLTSEEYEQTQHRRFRRGELDFLSNIQENLRPVLLVDLYDRLQQPEADPVAVLGEWHAYWSAKRWDEERMKIFLELLLDKGYSDMQGSPPVEPADRAKIFERLHYLTSPHPDEENQVDSENKALASTSIDKITVTSDALFHETDFSNLPVLFIGGVLANELVHQSRNRAAAGESDLAASFWRLDNTQRGSQNMSLQDVITVFFPKEGKVIKTGASLRNRMVVCCLNPLANDSKDFFLYPPYSDVMHRYDTGAPFAKKFTYGWDENGMSTVDPNIKKDGVFALLGVPRTRFSCVIIPAGLKEHYIKMVQALPFYLPAYSAETGERLF